MNYQFPFSEKKSRRRFNGPLPDLPPPQAVPEGTEGNEGRQLLARHVHRVVYQPLRVRPELT